MNAQNISILDEEVTIVEYKDQRVLTFSMIDKMHQRPAGTAKRNLNANKKHFTEGVRAGATEHVAKTLHFYAGLEGHETKKLIFKWV